MKCPDCIELSFWSKVYKRGPDDCWLWQGAPSKPGGYGRFKINYESVFAHRYSYELHFGKIPADGPQCVCHTCDVRMCMNPVHLWLGTHLENMADRNQKGRQAQGERHGRHASNR